MLRKLSRRFRALPVILIFLGTAAAVALLMSLAPEPESREPPPRIPFAQTGVASIGSGAIPVHGFGTVRPSAEVDIAPQVGGRVVWVDPGFLSGNRVSEGQTLFRIEEADYWVRVQEAEAALAASRVAVLREEEQAAIARAEYEMYARRIGSTSRAQANPLTLGEPQLAAARAAVDRDEGRLAEANLALSRTQVVAPFDGFVRNESVDVGQVVSPGQPVARLFASRSAEVAVPLSDADAALIPGLWRLGNTSGQGGVAARVSARFGTSTYEWDGYVDRSESFLDAETRTIDVVVRVPDPYGIASRSADADPPLLVGKFVDVEIEGFSDEPYFRIPRAALQSGDEVWAVGEGSTLRIVPVRVLLRANDEVFVVGDLEDNQAVVTGGLQFATPGMRVQTGDQ